MMSSRVWVPGLSCAPTTQLPCSQAALEAGLTKVKHPGHSYYFMIPGGRYPRSAPAS
jgi:hypothetical protein